MIASIKHKGWRLYYEKGDSSKLQRSHLVKIRLILTALDAISSEDDIKSLGKNIHPLKGEYLEYWSLSVTGNYRIVFRFAAPDVLDVDFLDYH